VCAEETDFIRPLEDLFEGLQDLLEIGKGEYLLSNWSLLRIDLYPRLMLSRDGR
jgi:hypothetical protein